MDLDHYIHRLIADHGPVTFADFMDLALYHPNGGFYASRERIGADGDFFTSPTAHPAFGALLAVQLYQMWQLLGRPSPFTVVEPGAANGLLCRDIIMATTIIDPSFAGSLRYLCIDRRVSTGLDRGFGNSSRIASNSIPLRGLTGCILSNELIDAMPVHQVAIRDGRLREIYVGLDGNRFTATPGDPSTPRLAERLARLRVELQEGQVAEINLGLDAWIREASTALDRGFILTVDYGRTASELYSSSTRFRGTLTTYRDHLQTDRPLERVGQQDISAHVDFTSLDLIGQDAGLEPLGYSTQSECLLNLGIGELLHRPLGLSRRGQQASRAGMRELIKRGGLGDFRVLAQGKNTGNPQLWSFHKSDEPAAILREVPELAPTPEHINLSAGRFPALEAEFDVSWDALWPPDPVP